MTLASGIAWLALTGPAALAADAPADADASCPPTASNILGPYYRRGAPLRRRLATEQEPGIPLRVSGRVLDPVCRPVARASVELWQTDAEGRYDNDTAEFRFRGRTLTDRDGRYQFDTIAPGRYPIGSYGSSPDGQPQYRPRHLHVKLTKRGFVPLVTQLYFRGEPENDHDPFIVESLIVDPVRSDASGRERWAIAFDFVLEPAPSAGTEQAKRQPEAAKPPAQPAAKDTDRDGLPDEYEARHSCLNPAVDEAMAHTVRAGGTEWVGLPGGEDADHDGATNLEEYRKGTDPCERPISR